ncbi:pyrroline-5-carboxylate reductase [Streptococcus massiliensis]|uniref:Pyrroline-5-carboxylate reductase n=1 Tax=Streptococcus massiliensis TaxID=313439 RepID=A0A380KX49_9STRE|nr:pyrroline-5-carboxylate reductase [Streptococcus massiliensis]SUN75704.1 pyrroline-5-carboxylate reductase [Streptococcus massiliensis]
MKIGFIGLGNMGASLARLVLAHKEKTEEILLANRSQEKTEKIIEEVGGCLASNQEVFAQADIIFLGVKPAQMADLLQEQVEILNKRESVLFVSMAAGLSLDQLQDLTAPQHRFVRIMPNTPITVGAGVISFVLSSKTKEADEQLLLHLLAPAGKLVKLEEKQMDAATALAGCGPAFVYQFIEGLSDAGVKNGLPRELALELACQTVLGAAKMIEDKELHPAVLTDQVASPAGATIAGLASLEADAFKGKVIKAVDVACKRTRELAK